jgi:hypothetical protein
VCSIHFNTLHHFVYKDYKERLSCSPSRGKDDPWHRSHESESTRRECADNLQTGGNKRRMIARRKSSPHPLMQRKMPGARRNLLAECPSHAFTLHSREANKRRQSTSSLSDRAENPTQLPHVAIPRFRTATNHAHKACMHDQSCRKHCTSSSIINTFGQTWNLQGLA